MRTNHNVGPWMGFWGRKMTLRKNSRQLNRERALVAKKRIFIDPLIVTNVQHTMLITGETGCWGIGNFLYCLCNNSINLKLL